MKEKEERGRGNFRGNHRGLPIKGKLGHAVVVINFTGDEIFILIGILRTPSLLIQSFLFPMMLIGNTKHTLFCETFVYFLFVI